jgi:hypothetical protein
MAVRPRVGHRATFRGKMTDPEQSRPEWRDEFLRDLPAFEQYAREMRAWQRTCVDARLAAYPIRTS